MVGSWDPVGIVAFPVLALRGLAHGTLAFAQGYEALARRGQGSLRLQPHFVSMVARGEAKERRGCFGHG